MAPEIEYKASVEKDLKRLGAPAGRRLLEKIEQDLRQGKEGEPLRGRFSGLYKLRIGDYRAIYTRTRQGYLVLRIGNRRDVYRGSVSREGTPAYLLAPAEVNAG